MKTFSRGIAYLVVLLLLFLLLSPLSLASEPIGDNWTSWKFDKEKYTYHNGILSLVNDRIEGEAIIAYDYPSLDESMTWQMRCLFTRKPTGQNYFKWHLFLEDSTTERIHYYVRPSDGGRTVSLIREVKTLTTGQTAKETLVTLSLRSPLVDWEALPLKVTKSQNRLQLHLSYADGTVTSSEPVEYTPGGTARARMILQAVYTKTFKESFHWTLPTITTGETSSSSLRILRIESVTPKTIRVWLDHPVTLRGATGTSNLTSIHLSDLEGDPSCIVVTFDEDRKEGVEYTIHIKGLSDHWGNPQELSFVIEEVTSTAHPTLIPEGIWISEIMSSPPSTGLLKDQQYIEIFNATSKELNLSDLTLRYRQKKISLPEYIVPSEGYVLLVPQGSNLLQSNPQCPIEHFPSLAGSYTLELCEIFTHRILDKVSITPNSYGLGLRRGGASLERLTFGKDGGERDLWQRSTSALGGTPASPSGMLPPKEMSAGDLVINEILLTPKNGGEKYLEIFNTTASSISLEDIYIAYRNTTDGEYSYSYLTPRAYTLGSRSYGVITPYPQTLSRLYKEVNPNALIEYVDFPSFSSTYTEIELRSRAGDTVIDRIVIRKQYLGPESKYRTGYALERCTPQADGTHPSSWAIAGGDGSGGSPTRANRRKDYASDLPADTSWPEGPDIDYVTMLRLLGLYPDRCSLCIFTMLGDKVLEQASGSSVSPLLTQLTSGRSTIPPGIYLIHVTVRGDEGKHDLHYWEKWLLSW